MIAKAMPSEKAQPICKIEPNAGSALLSVNAAMAPMPGKT